MPEQKDIIYYIITSIGILVTASFSYLVWRATQKSNELAQASYKLSESIINSQKELKKNLKAEYIRTVLKNAIKVKTALESQRKGLNTQLIREMPQTNALTKEQIAEYFTDHEREILTQTWDSLEAYLNRYWSDKNGNFKSTFVGNEGDDARNNVAIPLQKFDELITLFEQYHKEDE